MSEINNQDVKDSRLENTQYCYTEGQKGPMWQYKCPKCENNIIYSEPPKECPSCGELFNQLKWRIPPKNHHNNKKIPYTHLLPKDGFTSKLECVKWFAKKAGLNYTPHEPTSEEISDFVHNGIAPKLSTTYRTLLFRYFTELFRDGFESGDFSNWTGTQTNDAGEIVGVTDSQTHHGNYSAYVTVQDTADAVYIYKNFSGITEAYGRCYIKFDNLPTQTGHHNCGIGLHNQPGAITYSIIYYDGSDYYWGIRTWQDNEGYFVNHYETSASNFASGVWYCQEIYVKVDSSSGISTLWIDGIQKVTHTGYANDNQGNIVSAWLVNRPYTNESSTYTVRYDCVVVSDSYIGGHILFKDGFESNSVDNWSSTYGTVSVVNNEAYRGKYSCKAEHSGTWSWDAVRYLVGDSTEIYARQYVKFDTISSGIYCMFCYGDSGDICHFGIGSSTTWRITGYTAGSWSNYDSSSTTISTGVWYCIEGHCIVDGTYGKLEMWVDGKQVVAQTSLDTDDKGNITEVYFGASDWGVDSFNNYIDDCLVSDTYIGSNFIFENDLEQGDFTAWTGTYIDSGIICEASNTDTHNGIYSIYCDHNDESWMCSGVVYKTLSPILTEAYSRIYVKFTTWDSLDHSDRYLTFFAFSGTAQLYDTQMRLNVETDGTNRNLQLYYLSSGTTYSTSSGTTNLSLDTWYAIEVYCKVDASNGAVTVYLDNSTEISVIGLDNDEYNNIQDVICGLYYAQLWTGERDNFYIDDVVVSNSYIGLLEEFEDDFESADFSAWTGTSSTPPTVVSSTSYSGTYCMQSDFTGTYQERYVFYRDIVANPVHVRCYFKTTALPNSGEQYSILTMTQSNYSTFLHVGISNSGGTIRLWSYWSGSFYNDNYAFSTDTWYCLEFTYYQDSFNGEFIVYVDGEVVRCATGLNTSAYTIRGLRVGSASSSMSSSYSMYIDDVVVSNAYIGSEQQTETVSLPFSDGFESGDFSAWSGENENQGSVDVTTTNPHCGTYCLESTLSQGQNNGWGDCYTEISGNNPVYIRAMNCTFANPPNTATEDQTALCFRETTTGNGLAYAGIKNDNGTLKWWVWYRDEGSFYDELGNNFDSEPHHLEFAIYQDSSAGWVRLYVDGELEIEVTGLNNADRELNYASVGFSYSDAPTDSVAKFYADCVVVDDTLTGPEQEEEPPAGAEAGFETGDVSEFDDTITSSGTVTATDSVAHHGTYSCKCDVNADGSAYAEGYFDVAEQQPVYCRGYFRFNQLPETNKDYTLICFENTDGPTTVGYVQLIDDNGTKQWKMMRNTESTQYSTSTSNIPEADTWVCVEFVHGENIAKLWVDGDELLSHTDGADQDIDRVHVGACITSIDADDTLEIYVDCIVVDDEYVGPESEVTDLEVNNLAVNNTITIGQDTNLYRSSEDVLKTDDKFEANELQLGTSILSTNESVLYVKESDESPADMNVGTLTATELKTDELKTSEGNTYVLDLANMPNQGTNGYVLTAQGVDTSPVWAPAGSGSVTWTSVPSSIIPISDDTYDLGSDNSAWRDIYSNDGHIGNLTSNEVQVGTSGLSGDQGGAIELGDSAQSDTKPYIDFHYGKSGSEDFNVRLQNDGDKQLSITAISSGGSLNLENVDLTFAEDAKIYRGFTDHLCTDSKFTVGGLLYTPKGAKMAARAPFLSNLQMVNQIYGFDQTLFSPPSPPSGSSWPNDPNDGDLFNRTDLGLFYQYDITLPPEERWVSLGPNDGDVPVGISNLRFHDTKTGSFLNLSLTISKDNSDAPILSTDQGFLVKKDITAGGYLGTNQGAVFIGSGLTSQVDSPHITLMHSDLSCLEESYNRSAIPKAEQGTSWPPSPTEGDYFFRTDYSPDGLCRYNGSTWDNINVNGRTFWNLDTNEVLQYYGNTWYTLGLSSDFAGTFDTLHLKKMDGSPANLNVCNISVGNGDTISKQENTVKYSQQFNEAPWEGYQGNKNNVTQNTSDVMAPDGTQTAAKIEVNQGSGYCWGCFQTVNPSLQAGQRYAMSIWLKGTIEEGQGEQIVIGLNDDYNKTVTLTKYWKRYTFTSIVPQGGNTARGLQFYCVAPTTATYYVYGAQLENDKTAHTYTPTSNETITKRLVLTSGTGKTVVTGDLEVTGDIIGQITQVGEKGSDTTAANGEKTITLTETYSSPPLVFLQPIDASGRGIVLDLVSTTTSGFTVKAHYTMGHKHVAGSAGATQSFTMNVADESTHTHSIGSHKHAIGAVTSSSVASLETTQEDSHTHSTPDHKHIIGAVTATSVASLVTDSEPGHTHTGTASGNTASDGAHGHTLTGGVSSTSSTHTHSGDGTHPHAMGSESSHTHVVGGYTGGLYSGSPGSTHTHQAGSGTLQTGYGTSHVHSISGGDGGHSHTGGSHTHGDTFSIVTSTTHTHGFSSNQFTTSNNGNHSHIVQYTGGYPIYNRALTLKDENSSDVTAGALFSETTYASEIVYTATDGADTTGAGQAHSHTVQYGGSYTIYHRALTLKDINGNDVTAGALFSETTYGSETIYTASSTGNTGTGAAHNHTLDNKPPYVRSIYLRDENGTSYTIGATLVETTKTSANLYTEALDDTDYEVAVAFNYLVLPAA